MTSKAAKNDCLDKSVKDTGQSIGSDDSAQGKVLVTTKGVSLLVLPIALLLTGLTVSGFEISWLWALPIFGCIGSILVFTLVCINFWTCER